MLCHVPFHHLQKTGTPTRKKGKGNINSSVIRKCSIWGKSVLNVSISFISQVKKKKMFQLFGVLIHLHFFRHNIQSKYILQYKNEACGNALCAFHFRIEGRNIMHLNLSKVWIISLLSLSDIKYSKYAIHLTCQKQISWGWTRICNTEKVSRDIDMEE
jgi:hypothetical protein